MIAAQFHGSIGDFALDVAFEVPSTGVTGIVGPSGSGKTTLLRCLAGLVRLPGALTVDGMVWQDQHRFVPTERRRAGFVFQGPSLLPHLRIRDSLAYAAKRAAAPGPFAFDGVVAITGIAALLDRMPGELSGGQSQRAAIACALLSQPRLLLLDEPLAGLDGSARAEMIDALDGMLREADLPVFYVSHDLAEIERLTQRRIELDRGRCRAS